MQPNYYPQQMQPMQQMQPQPPHHGQPTMVVGSRHPDTVDFDDFLTHNMMSGYPKITKIQVWASQLIHGIQVWYTLNGAPVAKSKHFIKKANKKEKKKSKASKQVFALGQDEFIVEFSGRSSHVVDHLTIVTNKGNLLDVGGVGGNPFDFQIPQGFTIGALKGGFGAPLHSLGGVLVPIQGAQMGHAIQPGHHPQPGYAPMHPQQPGYAPMPGQMPPHGGPMHPVPMHPQQPGQMPPPGVPTYPQQPGQMPSPGVPMHPQQPGQPPAYQGQHPPQGHYPPHH